MPPRKLSTIARLRRTLGSSTETLPVFTMPMDDWQKTWHFEFQREYKTGTDSIENRREGEPVPVVSAKQIAGPALSPNSGMLASSEPPGRVSASVKGRYGQVQKT